MPPSVELLTHVDHLCHHLLVRQAARLFAKWRTPIFPCGPRLLCLRGPLRVPRRGRYLAKTLLVNVLQVHELPDNTGDLPVRECPEQIRVQANNANPEAPVLEFRRYWITGGG